MAWGCWPYIGFHICLSKNLDFDWFLSLFIILLIKSITLFTYLFITITSFCYIQDSFTLNSYLQTYLSANVLSVHTKY